MDIGSRQPYPAGALSNFAPHPFTLDGVACASMEGFLQSLKRRDSAVQAHVCSLVGMRAKRAGGRHWQRTQTLWWRGEPYGRTSPEYQALLDRAFDALADNASFRRALLATGDAVLTHSHGVRKKEAETCLTTREFVSRLTRIRERLARPPEEP